MERATAILDTGFQRAIKIASVAVYPLRASDGVSPKMVLGTMATRPALLVAISDDHGCTGWGEVWANFPPRGSLHKAHLIEDVFAPKLTDANFTEPGEIIAHLRKELGIYALHIGQEQVFEHIFAGLDTALWDLALRNAGRSFAEHTGITAHAKSYASSINRDDLEMRLARHTALGQSHFKVKLGFGEVDDIAFVRRARELCGADAHLMIDNNQSWSPDTARRLLDQLAEFDLLFSEEAIPSNTPLAEWEALARDSAIPLAAGENVYGVENFLALANAGIRYLQPDVAKWGGITGSLELARRLPSGARLWPHFMGTSVGQMAALSISAAMGETSVCEMDVNENRLRTELSGACLEVVNGTVTLPNAAGLVVPPTPEALSAFRDPFA